MLNKNITLQHMCEIVTWEDRKELLKKSDLDSVNTQYFTDFEFFDMVDDFYPPFIVKDVVGQYMHSIIITYNALDIICIQIKYTDGFTMTVKKTRG